MFVNADRSPGLVILGPGKERFEVLLELLRFRVIDGNDDGPEGRDPLDPLLLGLTLQIQLHVLKGHDPDNVALPDVGQPLGAQETVESLVPGDVMEIDRYLPLDLVLYDNVPVDNPGQGAQDRLDISLAHFQADRLRRKGSNDFYRLPLVGFSRFLQQFLGEG